MKLPLLRKALRRRWLRTLLMLAGDAVLIALALYLSFFARFEGQIPDQWLGNLGAFLGVALAIKLLVFYLFGLYRMSWAYVSFSELVSVFKAVSTSSILLGTLYFLLQGEGWSFPRSILILDYFLTLFLIGGVRSAKRIYTGWFGGVSGRGRRALIVGAGDAGEQVLRAMLSEKRSRYLPVGFVDDDEAKQGMSIHGVRVLGRREEIPKLVRDYGVEELLIAMPSAPPQVIRETVGLGRRAGLRQIRVLPGLHELISGRIGLADLREVRIEDLLGREPVNIDTREIEGFLKGKVVLVTGAAGSIGSELCRQIARFSPERLLALDQDESRLFELEGELKGSLSALALEIMVADIRDPQRIEGVFAQHRPQVVFHAAAYKHVPLMEAHPAEAVKTNVFGTLTLAEAALRCRSEKFVLISTDKAVNPTSVMGATKRLAEMIVQALGGRGETRFIAVRFGNVLGSRGSVIPLFQEQIRRGGPVTVTHEEMKRYFMITSEAVMLVLQAGAMGQGGEVFVLDMGDPVRIIDLARELIRLSGYEPDVEIPIVYTGPRPGEKLHEELLTAEEGAEATRHKQIYVARLSDLPDEAWLRERLDKLKQVTERQEIVELLRQLVPTYEPEVRAEYKSR